MRTMCFYLCYRRQAGGRIRWKHPTGGFVQKPESFVQGCPIGDFQLAAATLERRYHCGPHEELIIAEVFEQEEMRMARQFHRKWQWERTSFLELMNVS